MKEVDLSVIVPAVNEEANIRNTVEEIITVLNDGGLAIEIVMVDDGSSDDTLRVMNEIRAHADCQTKVISHHINLGLGSAVSSGYQSAEGRCISWLPSDGQFFPHDILRMYRRIGKFRAVIGVVRIQQRRNADGLLRVILSRGLRGLMRVLHPGLISFTGLSVVERAAVQGEKIVCRTGFGTLEVVDRVRRRWGEGAIFQEDVGLRPRASGDSKVANFLTTVKVAWDLIRLRVAYLREGPRNERDGRRDN